MKSQRHLPPLAYRALTPIYDTVLATVLRERRWKTAFLDRVAPAAGERILDIGCGTGTLSVWIKQRCPDVEVIGLDPDGDALQRARNKAESAGVQVIFRQGCADDLPAEPELAAESFDKVTSSLMLHHLPHEAKRRTFLAVRRLLRPGGTFHVVDWAQPADRFQRAVFLGTRLLDGFEPTRDNVEGRLPAMISAAGFSEVAEVERFRTLAGTLRIYRAAKPGAR